MGALYIQSCDYWLQKITPRVLSTSEIFLTRKEALYRDKAVHVYRSEQVLAERINQITSSFCATFHHFTILVAGVGLSFLSINDYDVVFSSSITTIFVPLGVFTCVFIEYAESSTLNKIWSRSRKFLRDCKAASKHKSVCYKFAAFAKPLDLKTAYPFFQIRCETFPLFMDQWIQFLVSMLIVSG